MSVNSDINDLKTQIDNAIDANDNGTPIPTPGSSGNDSGIQAAQNNSLGDQDRLVTPSVNNAADPWQEVQVDGGSAAAGNGIVDVNLARGAGDDASFSGTAEASADAVGRADMFTQNLEMGNNTQSNSISGSVTAGDYDAAASSGQGANFNNGQSSLAQESVNGLVSASQGNTLQETDSLREPTIVSESNIARHPTQKVDVNQSDPASSSAGDGINGTAGGSGSLGAGGRVGDDLSIDGASVAGSDASGVASAANQVLATGDNVQLNVAQLDVTGTDVNTVSGGGAGAAAGGAASLASTVSPANGEVNAQVAVNQGNALNDGGGQDGVELVDTPSVTNASQLTQGVNVDGGTASASDGIDINGSVGGNSRVDGDASIVGSAKASADAEGMAVAFTQDVSMGGNQQANVADVASVAGSVNAASAAENLASIEDGAGNLTAPTGSSDQAIGVRQTNSMDDVDRIKDAAVTNDGTARASEGIATQSVNVNGGTAEAGNGLAADGVVGNGRVGSDSDVEGSTTASASASGLASAFNQALGAGGNLQLNEAGAEVIGGSTATATSGENGAGVGDLADTASGAEVSAEIDVKSANVLDDTDAILSPTVTNNPFAGTTPDPITNVDQDVTVDGGTATSGNGIFQDDGVLGDVLSVGDDASISGLSSAQADASGTASAFNQSLAMGGNTQLNQAETSVTGGHRISASAGEDAAVVGALDADADGLADISADIGVDQDNTAFDGDSLNNPQVTNADGGIVEQTVASSGGTASAGNGIQQDNGGAIGGNALIKGDASFSGEAFASADATAKASVFNQAIETGSNAQFNQADAKVTGGHAVSAVSGSNDAVIDASDGAGTTPKIDPVVALDQDNRLDDADSVSAASVLNNGSVNQDATASGGSALSEDGISQVDGGTLGAANVAGDHSIAGSAIASADAAAGASAFNQTIDTGSNVQVNEASASSVGGDRITAVAGENDATIGAWETAPSDIAADSDAQITLSQTNDLLDDADLVTNASVVNNGSATQNVSADNSASQAISGDGIDQYYTDPDGADLGGSGVGDDSEIAGASSASSQATAAAGAFDQSIEVSGNGQQNTLEALATGGDSLVMATGEDNSEALGGNIPAWQLAGAPATPPLSAETTIDVSQRNDLDNKSDRITDATVLNDGTFSQNVSAQGGAATSGSGVVGDGGSGLYMDGPDSVGDDSSIAGSTSAEADAVAQASAFNQFIRTGNNVQINNGTIEVTGSNANTVSVGEDASGLGGTLASGYLAGNADTLISASQRNTIDDEGDQILGATVTNASGSNVEQSANAVGGSATAGNGIEDAGASYFSMGGTVGDDYSVTAEALASADAAAEVSAFNQTLLSGGNTQANAMDVDVVGGNDTLLFTGEDDSMELQVTPTGGQVAGSSAFKNGSDTVFTVEQANSLSDQDLISNPQVISANGTNMDQSVTVDGGSASTGDGILDAEDLFDFSAGDDLSIAAATSATADAMGVASAFNQTIVMGANVQANSLDVSVVGGSSTVAVIGEDDMA
ncbi:beta strand repeat-containing protein [Pseudovibrio exalbescens]|uniref:Uncharacterized protein n=1 Tax=Pseudovibrio exalbescens TaxID=197461 RepID=A0A1U7JJ67_9HYPH|nr:hypothetical protein [Pseudovibrio exalbescens]OKL44790.1 hypothetical protein A3843_06855 [Pseudovibrio exalbescens]